MKKSIKSYKLHELILSAGFVFILIIAGIFDHGSREFSPQENRALAQYPEIDANRLIQKRFQKDFEAYKNDQFPLRNQWMRTKSNLMMLTGSHSLNGVILGKEGYLMEAFAPDETAWKKSTEQIRKFHEAHPKLKKNMLIVPNAAAVLTDKLPYFLPQKDQSNYLNQLKAELPKEITWIDAMEALIAHKEEPLFYKGDHHWTSNGALHVFESYAKINKLDTSKLNYESSMISNSFHGTLASVSGRNTSDAIDVYLKAQGDVEYSVSYVEEQKKSTSLYDVEKLDTKDQYAVFLGGNHPQIEINTTAKENRRLLILKDSYANSFIPFLIPFYSRIEVVDPRYYTKDIDKLIKEKEITEVLFLYNANTFFKDNSLSVLLS